MNDGRRNDAAAGIPTLKTQMEITMSKYLNRIALAAIALSPLALAAASAPAAASPTLNFSIVTNQFNKPTLEFEYQGGKYVWKQQAINTQFSASADTNDKNVVWYGTLKIQSNSVSGSAQFFGVVPVDVKSWSLSGPMTFPVNFLNVYKNGFADYCEKNGKAGSSHVNHNLSILFTAMQAYGVQPKGTGTPSEVPSGAGVSGPFAQRSVNMPMIVSCGAKPAGGLVQEPGEVPFRVKSIALNYGGVVQKTKPNAATECKQAKLTVTIHTSKAGVVNFRLHKKIGNGMSGSKQVQVYAKSVGGGNYVASHQENVSVTQTSLVQTMAEDLVNPVNLSTGWKDVTLTCEDIGGGFAGTPGNANPDNGNLPRQPKRVFDGKGGLATTPGTSTNPDDANFPRQPKRVFDGAKNLAPPTGNANPDNRNARQPFKPVIAPATPIKTAPVPRAQRDSRFIGTAAPRVQ